MSLFCTVSYRSSTQLISDRTSDGTHTHTFQNEWINKKMKRNKKKKKIDNQQTYSIKSNDGRKNIWLFIFFILFFEKEKKEHKKTHQIWNDKKLWGLFIVVWMNIWRHCHQTKRNKTKHSEFCYNKYFSMLVIMGNETNLYIRTHNSQDKRKKERDSIKCLHTQTHGVHMNISCHQYVRPICTLSLSLSL